MTSKLRNETAFSAEVQSVLRREPVLDVLPTETAIDDGLSDLLVTDTDTGRSSFVELKVGTVKNGNLLFRTLQPSQVNFLASRAKWPTQKAFILIEHPEGLYLIQARFDMDWRRSVIKGQCLLSSSVGKPIEWSGLAAALWPR